MQLVGMRMLWEKARQDTVRGAGLRRKPEALPGGPSTKKHTFSLGIGIQAFQEVTFLSIDVFPFFSRLGFYPGS